MLKPKSKEIVIIGAGNVATQIGIALHKAGYKIVQVYSRTEKSAQQLAEKLNTNSTTKLSNITKNAAIYIVAINDDAIGHLIKQINFENKLLLHTSGTMGIDVLKEGSLNYGVFYPLQTLQKEQTIKTFKNIPLCIEANTKENEKKLQSLAKSISKNVYHINSEQRKIVHLAAVFACNFTNHLYAIADEILTANKIPFRILFPLIKTTATQIKTKKPLDAQTGPAIRGDKTVLKKHLRLLEKQKKIQEIYSLISTNIVEKHYDRG